MDEEILRELDHISFYVLPDNKGMLYLKKNNPIKYYQLIIDYLKGQIRTEKDGLILDSGTILPHVVNDNAIAKLEEQISWCEKIISELN